MKINAYDNLLSSLQAGLKTTAAVDKPAGSTAAGQAAELGKGFGAILEKALVEPDGSDAVAKARQALLDGSLENQQAFESAADGLLNYGI
jgi:hypothetical protein